MSDENACVDVDGIIERYIKQHGFSRTEIIVDKLNTICLYKIDPESCKNAKTVKEFKKIVFEELDLKRLQIHKSVLYINDKKEEE